MSESQLIGKKVMYSTGVHKFEKATVSGVVETSRGLLLELDNGVTLTERQAHFVMDRVPTA